MSGGLNFVETSGVVEVEAERILVTLDRRSHNPILREAALDRNAPPSPGFGIAKSALPMPNGGVVLGLSAPWKSAFKPLWLVALGRLLARFRARLVWGG
jgi:hypothetical protein